MSKQPTKRVVRFKFRNDTPGALRYQEIDESGKELKNDNDNALIGTLYLRKAGNGGTVSQKLTIEISEG